jgi:hypothetical protein
MKRLVSSFNAGRKEDFPRFFLYFLVM